MVSVSFGLDIAPLCVPNIIPTNGLVHLLPRYSMNRWALQRITSSYTYLVCYTPSSPHKPWPDSSARIECFKWNLLCHWTICVENTKSHRVMLMLRYCSYVIVVNWKRLKFGEISAFQVKGFEFSSWEFSSGYSWLLSCWLLNLHKFPLFSIVNQWYVFRESAVSVAVFISSNSRVYRM